MELKRSREQRFKHCLLLLAVVCFTCFPPPPSSGQSDGEEQRLRDLFLKSRREMEIVPSPTPTPKPKPVPAASPIRKAISPTPTAAPAEPAESETPEPSPTTPEPTPTAETPKPTSTPKKRHRWFVFGDERQEREIIVQKSGTMGSAETVPAPQRGGQWHFLTPAIRQAIDEARVARNRWKYIIVHNSGTRQGDARIFDYYHRNVRRMPNGLAYHFVIGNGSSSGNGQIEIGGRWTRQLSGGHVHSDYLNYIALGICLVGDFNRDLPTQAQYQALDELIRYLRVRVGKVDNTYSMVRGHREINPRPTDCPGSRFPLNWLHHTFPDH